ncbi:MAG: HEAT repeat domain-containing protein, partial [Planctomycetota bacterium]
GAHGLEMGEDPRAVDVLIDQIPKSKGTRLFWMVQSLGRIGDPKAVPTLIDLLAHEPEMIRYEAMRALRWRWYWHRKDVQAALKKHPVFKELVEPKPSLEDQEPNTWVLRHWPVDFDDYRACNTSYEAGLMFDRSTGKIMKWGAHGQRCDTPQLGETWLWDPAKNEWERSEAPVEPYGMCGTWGTIYDKANRCVVSVQATGCNHGWQWSWGRATRVSVPWLYFGEQDRWAPVRPAGPNPGPRGFCPLAYHDRAQVTMLYRGQGGWGDHYAMWLYDAYTNEWRKRPAVEPRPGGNTNFGWVYLPELNKTLRIGGSYGDPSNKTWLYDLEMNTWTDAKAKGDPPAFRQPVDYDPVSKSVVAWRLHSGHAPAVWQYSIAKNEWKKLSPAKGMTPHHDSVDITYDPRHNVFVLDGGHLNWHSDHIAVREVWTYKLTPGGPPEKAGDAPAAVERKRPRFPLETTASIRPDRTVDVDWSKSASPDIVGYNVYAATMQVGDRAHPSSMKEFGEWTKLNEKPLGATSFHDNRVLGGPSGFLGHELRGYVIKAVNRAGIESGPSSLARTLTSSVPSVVATERPDGSTLVTWRPVPEKHIRGYAVYRMDEYRHSLPIRITPYPVQGTSFVDWCEARDAERRRYYVVAIDALGQKGEPSTGAWAFGRP